MVCEEQHAAYQPMEDVGRMDALQYLGAVAPVLEAEGEWAAACVTEDEEGGGNERGGGKCDGGGGSGGDGVDGNTGTLRQLMQRQSTLLT